MAALIFDEQGRALLLRHTYRKFEWGIPAGSLEYHEQPADAILREFYEETGIRIQIERLLTAVSVREDNHLTIVYLRKLVLQRKVARLPETIHEYFPRMHEFTAQTFVYS